MLIVSSRPRRASAADAGPAAAVGVFPHNAGDAASCAGVHIAGQPRYGQAAAPVCGCCEYTEMRNGRSAKTHLTKIYRVYKSRF